MSIVSWFMRIHIGRWPDRQVWQKKIEKKSLDWIKRTPVVPVSDKGRLLFRKANENIQSWQYAGLLMGLDLPAVTLFINSHPKLLSSAPSVDKALLMYVLHKKGVISKEQLRLFAQELDIQNGNTVPYRSFLQDVRFVDAIGLLSPFLVACGMEESALAQIEEYDKILLNGVFPPHAFDIRRKIPLGVYDWGRGLGWYILGITETVDLKGNRTRILRLAEEMLNYRLPSGGLGSLFFSDKRSESSGTALLGLLFLKAYELTSREDYLSAAVSAEESLRRATRRDGAIDYCQGDSLGIGLYSQRFDILPFAQGITLFFSKKLDRFLK